MSASHGIGPTGRLSRFQSHVIASRHIERRAEPERAPVADPVRARDLAEGAHALLHSAAFEAVMDDLRQGAYFDLMNSEPGVGGEAQRTTAHYKLTILEQLDAKLRALIEDAKFAAGLEADNSEANNP